MRILSRYVLRLHIAPFMFAVSTLTMLMLLDQLANGGRLVIPVGPRLLAQDLQVWTKDAAGEVTVRNVLAVAFVPMTGEARGK